jgi:hypothetical protein
MPEWKLLWEPVAEAGTHLGTWEKEENLLLGATSKQWQ